MESTEIRKESDRLNGPTEAFQQENVVNFNDTALHLLPVAEASLVQTRPGPVPQNLTIHSSEKVVAMAMRHRAASITTTIPENDFFGFAWWESGDDTLINGHRARPSVIYTQGSLDGLYVAGGARQTGAIAVRRNDLITTVAALRGVVPEDLDLDFDVLQLSPETASLFLMTVHAMTKRALNGAAEAPQKVGAGVRAGDQSEALIGLLAGELVRSLPGRRQDKRPHRPERVVRKVEEYYLANPRAAVSLADLCAAAGVGQSALYRAFNAVCDEPPLAYLHKRRLADARRVLVTSSRERGAVKRAALEFGLTELGRFSVEYRQLFGESPSNTLSRTAPL